MRVWLVAGAILAVLGGSVAVVALGLMGDDAGAPALVPQDSLAVVHATLDPSLDQKRALLSLSKRLPEDAQKQLEQSLPKALDNLLGEANLDYEQDIKPWLGGEVAAFITGDIMTEPDGAALLETTDAEKSLEVARRVVTEEAGEPTDETYKEVAYSLVPKTNDDEPQGAFGVVDDFLVIGTHEAFKATVDAGDAGSIEDNASYSELVGSLTPDRLLTYWVDTPKLFDAATADMPAEEAELFASSPLLAQQQPQAGALLATEESVVFEAVSDKPEDNPGLFQVAPNDAGFLGSLPDTAWFSFLVPAIGQNLEGLLDSVPDSKEVEQQFSEESGLNLREDVLSWMGDGMLFVAGERVEALGGGIVVQSSDAEATTSFLDRIVDTGLEQGVAVRPAEAGGLKGFELADASVPVRVTALGGDRLVLAVDAPDVREEQSAVAGVTGDGGRLGETTRFRNATATLGEGYAPFLYLDVNSLTQVIKSTFGESSAPEEFTEAEPYLQRLSHVVGGTRDDGARIMQRLVIGTSAP
jgi:hypothetical protein